MIELYTKDYSLDNASDRRVIDIDTSESRKRKSIIGIIRREIPVSFFYVIIIIGATLYFLIGDCESS